MIADDPELTALLRRCKEEPDDPAARRILGDWLEENGDGEALRALADALREPVRSSYHFHGPYVGLDRDGRKIAAHAPALLAPLVVEREWGFEGGLFSLRCTAAELADGLPPPPLPGGWGWIGRMVVTDLTDEPLRLGAFEGRLHTERTTDSFEPVLNAVGLERLTGLEVSHAGRDGPALVERLNAVPFAGLVDLGLRGNDLGPDDVARLVSERRLRVLNLQSNPLGDGGALALAQSPSADTLRVLDLSETGVGAAGLTALAEAAGRLKWLSLTNNRGITLAALRHALPRIGAGLEYLCLAFLDLGDGMCTALADVPELTRLRQLDVSGDTAMTLEGIERLVHAESLRGLHWLGIPTRLKSEAASNGVRREGLYLA